MNKCMSLFFTSSIHSKTWLKLGHECQNKNLTKQILVHKKKYGLFFIQRQALLETDNLQGIHLA